MSYNVGNENLSKSTLLKLLNVVKVNEAALQFSRWNRAGGKIIKGLISRRQLEVQLFIAA